jgi:hypothetical protein
LLSNPTCTAYTAGEENAEAEAAAAAAAVGQSAAEVAAAAAAVTAADPAEAVANAMTKPQDLSATNGRGCTAVGMQLHAVECCCMQLHAVACCCMQLIHSLKAPGDSTLEPMK